MGIYFPVLRWKLGERGALSTLSQMVLGQIEPIFEFPTDCDYLDRKVTEFVTSAINDWGTNRPFFVDFSGVDFEDAPTGTNHPANTILREAYEQHLAITPIIKLDMDIDLLQTLRHAFSQGYFRNVALRITDNEEDSAPNDAQSMLGDLGIAPGSVDLIIDFGDVSNGLIRPKIRSLGMLLAQFGTQYRRVILISGAIPNDLSNHVGTDDSQRLPRYDWRLWLQVHRDPNLANILFGDYTVMPCDSREVPFLGAPKIRYTLDDEWFIIKGHRSRGRDNQRQNQSLAIVNAPFFRGAQNSFGENRINQCANGQWGPGSSTNWVTNDISQHITFVTSQASAILAVP